MNFNKVVARNTFSILFFIVRSKKNKHGEHPIYCKVTVHGKSREFSTAICVVDEKWKTSASKVAGNNESAKTANHTLDTIRINLQNTRADLLSAGITISAENIVNKYLGKAQKKYSLIEIHELYNESHVKLLIGKDYAKGTYERYKTSLEHVKNFISYKYRISDMSMQELNLSFANDYEIYLKTVKNCAHNTAIKYIKNLKAVINYSVRNEFIKNNPLDRYRPKLDRIDKEFLTEHELSKIENKNFENDRLNEVRDVFILCCYTGLSYSDVAKLNKENIVIGIDGRKHIKINRTKTSVLSNIPILEKALHIIEKYKNNEYCIIKNTLLPVNSNQKQNAYLKEIGNLCECNKNLTTHTARHTFATLMLTKGVSIESISSMLGHTNIKTTQIYSKVIGEKVAHEMSRINQELKIAK